MAKCRSWFVWIWQWALPTYSRYFEFKRMPTTTSAVVIHLRTAWHPWGRGVRKRASIFRTRVCAVRQGVGCQPSKEQFHISSIKRSGWGGRSHRRTAPEEGQVGAERSIPESIRIQECPIRLLSNTRQLLISKRLRSILPTTSNHLRPRAVHPDIAIERLEKKHSKTLIYNQGARELKLLEVHIQTKAVNWKPATVLGQCSICLTPCVPGTEESIADRRHLLTTRSLSAKMSTATSESIKESESEPNQNPTDPGSLQWPVRHLILSSCEATCETWFMSQLRKTLPKTSSCVDFLFRSFSKKGNVSIAAWHF